MRNPLFQPHPALNQFIDHVFITKFESTADLGISPVYRFVPSHTRFIAFSLLDKVSVKKETMEFVARERSIIVGPQLNPVTLDLGKAHNDVVVCFKPCGLYRLLGLPMHELLDIDLDARLLLGNDIDILIDKLQNAESDDLKNTTVQDYFLSKIKTLKPLLSIDLVMQELVEMAGSVKIEDMASRACLSLRQFERKCLDRIGMPPKLFAKLIRFSKAYRMKEMMPSTPWPDIAYYCGYYDQMHFIKDFKYFAGITPGLLKESDILKSIRARPSENDSYESLLLPKFV